MICTLARKRQDCNAVPRAVPSCRCKSHKHPRSVWLSFPRRLVAVLFTIRPDLALLLVICPRPDLPPAQRPKASLSRQCVHTVWVRVVYICSNVGAYHIGFCCDNDTWTSIELCKVIKVICWSFHKSAADSESRGCTKFKKPNSGSRVM